MHRWPRRHPHHCHLNYPHNRTLTQTETTQPVEQRRPLVEEPAVEELRLAVLLIIGTRNRLLRLPQRLPEVQNAAVVSVVIVAVQVVEGGMRLAAAQTQTRVLPTHTPRPNTTRLPRRAVVGVAVEVNWQLVFPSPSPLPRPAGPPLLTLSSPPNHLLLPCVLLTSTTTARLAVVL